MLCGGKKGVKALLRLAVREAARQAAPGAPPFIPPAKSLRLRRRGDRFYLTSEGIVLFWEPDETAPESAGPVTIFIPYEAVGMAVDLSDPLPAKEAKAAAPNRKKGRLFAALEG
jgi:hypothetical protein